MRVAVQVVVDVLATAFDRGRWVLGDGERLNVELMAMPASKEVRMVRRTRDVRLDFELVAGAKKRLVQVKLPEGRVPRLEVVRTEPGEEISLGLALGDVPVPIVDERPDSVVAPAAASVEVLPEPLGVAHRPGVGTRSALECATSIQLGHVRAS
jgi:hypothetical protein